MDIRLAMLYSTLMILFLPAAIGSAASAPSAMTDPKPPQVTLDFIFPPSPLIQHGTARLVYEMVITNYVSLAYTLDSIEVAAGRKTFSYSGDALKEMTLQTRVRNSNDTQPYAAHSITGRRRARLDSRASCHSAARADRCGGPVAWSGLDRGRFHAQWSRRGASQGDSVQRWASVYCAALCDRLGTLSVGRWRRNDMVRSRGQEFELLLLRRANLQHDSG